MKYTILMFLAVGLLVAADDPTDEAIKDELRKLEGTWVAVSAERDGKPRSPEDVKGFKLVVKDGKITFFDAGKADAATFKLNPTKKPKELEVGKKPGIYLLEADNLKICLGRGERPKEFATKPDSGEHLYVFKRAKN